MPNVITKRSVRLTATVRDGQTDRQDCERLKLKQSLASPIFEWRKKQQLNYIIKH